MTTVCIAALISGARRELPVVDRTVPQDPHHVHAMRPLTVSFIFVHRAVR